MSHAWHFPVNRRDRTHLCDALLEELGRRAFNSLMNENLPRWGLSRNVDAITHRCCKARRAA